MIATTSAVESHVTHGRQNGRDAAGAGSVGTGSIGGGTPSGSEPDMRRQYSTRASDSAERQERPQATASSREAIGTQ